jgi:hypothetical protein
MLREHTSDDRRADEAHRIDGVYRVTKNVVEIGSKPLERSAQ